MLTLLLQIYKKQFRKNKELATANEKVKKIKLCLMGEINFSPIFYLFPTSVVISIFRAYSNFLTK